MNKVHIIFNPSSGRGRSAGKEKKLKNIFNKYNLECRFTKTESEEHLREISKKSVLTGENIIGIGGDTTFSIIADSILKNSEKGIKLGMIGTGSVNDITRGLGYEKAELIAGAVKKKSIKSMDVGGFKFNGNEQEHYFLGSLSSGLGSLINEYVSSLAVKYPRAIKNQLFLKAFGGYFGVWSSFKEGHIPFSVTVRLNGEKSVVNTSLLVFLNTPKYSGDLLLSPNATPFDGKLDLCILKTHSFMDTFGMFIDVKRRKYKRSDSLIKLRSDRFSVEFDSPRSIQFDGELVKDIKTMNLFVASRKLDIFFPE